MYWLNLDISFGFSEQHYEAEEGVGNTIPIKVVKHQKNRLATPVTLRVNTFTINGALNAGIIPDFPGVDLQQPSNQAGTYV